MSVITMLCEEPCPVHQGMHCLREKDHAMPHKGAFTMKSDVPARWGGKRTDSIVVEWQPVVETHAGSFPPITRRCRFCGWAEEACHRPCPQAGDHLHSVVDVT